MSEPALSRENFIARVIEIVRAKFPLVKIIETEGTFSLRVNGHTAALENLYRGVALRPEDMQRHVERWMVELLRAAEGTPDRTGKFDDVKDRILPMVLSSASSEVDTSGLVTQPLVEPLFIAYAIDSDRTISYIPKAMFDSWKVSIEDVHEIALQNLILKSEAINAHAAQDEDGQISLILFQTMDGYDASRLLLPTLHDRLREHLGSPFAAGIPNRDILLCFRDDAETVQRLRTQIKEDFKQMPNQVTDALLLITPDGIAPHD
jgi:uncharacterized protein YtpQ (UPF0354 family)